jgi:hypothetical protein
VDYLIGCVSYSCPASFIQWDVKDLNLDVLSARACRPYSASSLAPACPCGLAPGVFVFPPRLSAFSGGVAWGQWSQVWPQGTVRRMGVSARFQSVRRGRSG